MVLLAGIGAPLAERELNRRTKLEEARGYFQKSAVLRLLGRTGQRFSHIVIGKLFEPGFAPRQAFDMPVRVDIICARGSFVFGPVSSRTANGLVRQIKSSSHNQKSGTAACPLRFQKAIQLMISFIRNCRLFL